MADISKINVNSTTYNLKDSRLPDLNSSTTQYLRGDGTWATPTVQTMSGNVDVSDEGTYMLIEPGSGGGGGGGTYQSKTNIDPTTSSQTITPDAGYDALSSVQINAMPSGTAGTPTATKGTVSNHSVSVTPSVTNTTGYITGSTKTGTAVSVSASELVSGNKEITANGTGIDVANYSTVSVNVSSTAKNIQVYSGTGSRKANSYGATSVTLTVSKSGTYNVSYCAARGSSSGTMGTQLYVNSTASTQKQTWTGTYWQHIELTNQSYNKNDVLTIYATSGNNSRTVYVGNLIIEEV